MIEKQLLQDLDKKIDQKTIKIPDDEN